MAKKDRTRIDYMPGQAAIDALALAAAMFPKKRQQALIDKLVITGLCALTWKLPELPKLWGTDRDRWKLPEQFNTVSESAKD
jgi:hypothetical protein